MRRMAREGCGLEEKVHAACVACWLLALHVRTEFWPPGLSTLP
jgi:hypothetical protein